MIVPDPQEFGGLEEIATMLAVDLRNYGHQVSVLTSVWASFENQYLRRMQQNDVEVVQPPKWLSLATSNWPTKQRLLATIMRVLRPVIWVLAIGLMVGTGVHWEKAWQSAFGWLQGQLSLRFISPDRRDLMARLVLSWWYYRWKPDLLHVHGYADPASTLLSAVDWANSHKLAVIYELHQTPDTNFHEWESFRTHINKADRIVAVSDKSANSLRQLVGVDRPIVVIGPIVADPDFTGKAKMITGVEPEKMIEVTTIARLVKEKGLHDLLVAIDLVRVKYPETVFKVFGDGPLRRELLDHANRLGLGGEDIFVGSFTSREQLADVMAKTDIFVMSSLLEGQPLAIVEAMAYGRPIVATAVGGIPELIASGENGLLCEPRDPSCLAESITRLIEDASLRAKFGTAARDSYENGPFQPEKVSRQFMSLYRQVLQERQDSPRSKNLVVEN